MKLEWVCTEYSWTLRDHDAELWVVQCMLPGRQFVIWHGADKEWGDFQSTPEGLSDAEAKQYMETIWRMEG